MQLMWSLYWEGKEAPERIIEVYLKSLNLMKYVFLMKAIRNFFYITLPSLLVLLLILELFFRFVIKASDPPMSYFYEKEKLYAFADSNTNGIITIGKAAEIKANWHINNKHWNYPIDYSEVKEKKLISVIGDSYIEAFQVNVDKSYPFLLRSAFNNEYEVYAFGKSGAPLSQYLHMSRYVNRHFKSDILIFNIVLNDFDESIRELNPSDSQFLQVSFDKNDSITETVPQTNNSYPQYQPWKRLLYKSAFFRYLYLNIKVSEIRAKYLAPQKYGYEGNIDPQAVQKNKELILKAMTYLVKKIKEENKDKRVVFVMDAPREAIYNDSLDKSKVAWMYDMMRNICLESGVEFLDLTPYMKADFGKNKIKFNSALDGHWNEYGHHLVAEIISAYLRRYK